MLPSSASWLLTCSVFRIAFSRSTLASSLELRNSHGR